jgi:hypothetical protein
MFDLALTLTCIGELGGSKGQTQIDPLTVDCDGDRRHVAIGGGVGFESAWVRVAAIFVPLVVLFKLCVL